MNQQRVQCMQQLKDVQGKIMRGLQQLNDLNNKYKMKTQKKFLKTFLRIMDKMSNQLLEAQENYRNIDKQIETDTKCIQLSKQLNFFKSECLQLKKQLDTVKMQLQKQKLKNQMMNQQKKQLNSVLQKKIKIVQKYKSISLSQQKQKLKNRLKPNQVGWKSIDLQKQENQSTFKKKYHIKKFNNPFDLQQHRVNLIQSYRMPIEKDQDKSYLYSARPMTKTLNRVSFTREQTPINSTQVRSIRKTSHISQLLT